MKFNWLKANLAAIGVGAALSAGFGAVAYAETAMDLAQRMQAAGYTDVAVTKMQNGHEVVTGYVNGRKHEVEYAPDGMLVKNELEGDEEHDDEDHDYEMHDDNKPKRGQDKAHENASDHRAPRDHGATTSHERSDGKSTEAKSGAKKNERKNSSSESGKSGKKPSNKGDKGKDKGSEKSGGKKP